MKQYSKNLQTIGDHIRKKRIESGQLQREVAVLIGVSEDSLTYWENNRVKPQVYHYPKIIDYLGYYPFEYETESFAGKLKYIRHCYGWSVAKCAMMLLVSVDALKRWEQRKHIPNPENKLLILEIWNALPFFSK